MAEDIELLLKSVPAKLVDQAARLSELHRRLWARAGGATANDAVAAEPSLTWNGSRFFVQVYAFLSVP